MDGDHVYQAETFFFVFVLPICIHLRHTFNPVSCYIISCLILNDSIGDQWNEYRNGQK